LERQMTRSGRPRDEVELGPYRSGIAHVNVGRPASDRPLWFYLNTTPIALTLSRRSVSHADQRSCEALGQTRRGLSGQARACDEGCYRPRSPEAGAARGRASSTRVVRLRRKVLELNGILGSLTQTAANWERMQDGRPRVPPVSEEEVEAARLSPGLIQRLRRRLGLSQMALARVVGVSAPAVAHWKTAETAPAGQHRATVVSLRKVWMREVNELLTRLAQKRAPRRSHTGSVGLGGSRERGGSSASVEG